MNKKNEYDFLRELTKVDDEKISEIARKYPMPDKSALKRINALCEEKLAMKENVLNNIPEEMENVEVIRNIPWYRRPAFTAAACFTVLIGITGGIMAIFSGKSNGENVPDLPPLTIVKTTTEEFSTETTIDITETAETTSDKKNTKTTAAKESKETTTEKNTSKKQETETAEPIEEENEDTTETEQPANPPETTTTAVTAETPTEAPTEVPTETPVKPADEFTKEMAEEFLNTINYMEQLMSCGLEINYDKDDKFTSDSGMTYVKINESRFSTVAELESYVRSYLTDNCIENRYLALVRNEYIERFVDTENGLYTAYAPTTDSFRWLGDEFTVEKKSDDMYVIHSHYCNFGFDTPFEVNVIKTDDGSWKIDHIKDF